MAQEITRADLDRLRIDKKRMKEMTLGELRGTSYDTRNGLQSRKPEAVSRTALSQSYTELTNEVKAEEIKWDDPVEWGEAENVLWDARGTRGLSMDYDAVSRSALSQGWGNVTRQ